MKYDSKNDSEASSLLVKSRVKKNTSPSSPTLTFVLPTFNREKTLGSALYQICKEIEHSDFKRNFSVIISENFSLDRSFSIAKSYEEKYSFVKVIRPPSHLSTGEDNLFFAIDEVATDYIWSFADDDQLISGGLDYLYNNIRNSDADFFIINTQFKDSNGDILKNQILEMDSDIVKYDSISSAFCEIGAQTILASFSSVVYRSKNMRNIRLKEYLKPCPIYAHVFAYLEAFHTSHVEVLALPLIVARRTTGNQHWDAVGRKFGWYSLYPWTGGLAAHILRSHKLGVITPEQYANTWNYNEVGRYNLVGNLVVQFILQLITAIDTGEPREIPPLEDFSNIRSVLELIPYVSVDTIAMFYWCENNFHDVVDVVAPLSVSRTSRKSLLFDSLYKLNGFTDPFEFCAIIKKNIIEKLNSILSSFVGMNTSATASKPNLVFDGRSYVVFRWVTKYILMKRDLFVNNWRIISPNTLDITDCDSDWYVVHNEAEVYKRFLMLETSSKNNSDSLSEVFISNNRFFELPPLTLLKAQLYLGDADLIIDSIESLDEFSKLRESICILHNVNHKRDLVNLGSLNTSWDGFIQPKWYLDNYIGKVRGVERAILERSPQVHYFIFGKIRGWSISPFFDEITYNSKIVKQELRASEINFTEFGVIHFLLNFDQNINFFRYFSSSFYIQQLGSYFADRDNNLSSLGTPPIVDFLKRGITLGLHPHPDWDEDLYLKNNKDVSISVAGQRLGGWLHWCHHGRFEKRTSGLTTTRIS
jgi:hypothetical protein